MRKSRVLRPGSSKGSVRANDQGLIRPMKVAQFAYSERVPPQVVSRTYSSIVQLWPMYSASNQIRPFSSTDGPV